MLGLIYGTVEYMLQKPERKFLFLGIDNAGKTTALEQLKVGFGQKKIDLSKIPPTIGFNVGKMEVNGVNAIFWDLGGQKSFRTIWRNYFSEAQGIAFIVDSADPDRIIEARDVLKETLLHELFTQQQHADCDSKNFELPETESKTTENSSDIDLTISESSDKKGLNTSDIKLKPSISNLITSESRSLPLALLCNKCDLETAIPPEEIEKLLNLDVVIQGSEVFTAVKTFKVSATQNKGLEEAIRWLVAESMKTK